MAITLTTVTRAPVAASNDVTPWSVNATSSDHSGTEIIKARPGAGYELCITRLEVFIGAAITVTFGGDEVSSAPEDVLIGPLGGAVMHIPLDFRRGPLVVRANHDFVMDASGAGVVTVYVEGFTRVASGEYSATISASPSASASASRSASPSASVSSSPSSSASSSISASPSSSASSSVSSSPSASASASPSSSASASASASVSSSPSSSPSSSESNTPSASISASPSSSPSGSKSSSASPTPSESPSTSLSPSPSQSPSASASA